MQKANRIITFAHSRTMRDRGFALVVVLLLVVALTFVAISGIRNSTLQERMAGNLYFRSLAFNESEAALRSTVAKLSALVGETVATPTAASDSSVDWRTLIVNGASQSYWTASSSWTSVTGTRSQAGSVGTYAVNAIAEQVAIAPESAGCQVNVGKSVGCNMRFTRMSARSVDANTGAAAITQQFWAFPSDK